MKTKRFAILWMFAGISLLLSSCNGGTNNVDDAFEAAVETKSSGAAVATDECCCTFSGTLTEADIVGLMEMREEEKLARDVYLFFYEKYQIPVFRNISKAESTHMNAVLYLLNGYGLEDPALDAEGEFRNPLFSDLFLELTEQGSASLEEALKVGAYIEEYDIADLMKLIDETENEDIQRVYGNLLRGSTFHLKAFTGILAKMGEPYSPVIISEELFNEITSMEVNDENSGGSFTPGVCDGTGPNV
ncbi:hypothetical protein SAMN05444274_1198 [Mariniphaga anaerophila]|uniref:DUF2202 domain-containing protein n=1 Tax=Mariniphaga anaerophila TaxID=1484053 RepID=A0A1M5GC26_9BACT|nr:DUF2202 domain-containing protein [Mariniphaga anaerophila]SHG01293.1 hypothetical protein SAMN05444274_1198 [Mariniphaga anaerophila]